MSYNNVLIVSDNLYLVKRFREILDALEISENRFKFCCTSAEVESVKDALLRINVKQESIRIAEEFDLVISLHSKQIFPAALVNSVKCINIHPGFNPYNRGWYPQVFSIINKLPVGATIHEMDQLVDHGKIIDQMQVNVNAWDTSMDVYNKVLDTELELMKKNLPNILENNYEATEPKYEGNYNSIGDFRRLLEIDLTREMNAAQLIDTLRALTHGDFANAYFRDPESGRKVFVKVKLDPE